MLRESHKHFRFDWITIFLFFLLVGFGWLNILSASHVGTTINYFDFTQPFGKQLIFIFLTVGLIILLLAVDAKFYDRFSGLIYIVSMLSLVGLFIFGKNVNGATSWYAIGSMTIQPSEFAKAFINLGAFSATELNSSPRNTPDANA